MATFEADIKDVVRNYDLKPNEGFLFCLFEAVSNSLYCCRENNNINIAVHLRRTYRANEVVKDADNFVRSFSVTDNGAGFTDENFDKFTRKIYKTNHEGGKGLGRIAFLKVFDSVRIESTYWEGNAFFTRKFSFSGDTIQDSKETAEGATTAQTTVFFDKIRSGFQGSTQKDIDYYSDEVLRHFYVFLYYLLEQKKTFEIKFVDDSGKTSERVINTARLEQDKVTKESFVIKDAAGLDSVSDVTFEVVHIKTNNVEKHKAFYVVDERSAGEIQNLDFPPAKFEDKDGYQYNYYVYLKSAFFSQFLNESRTKLSLPNGKSDTKTDNSAITEERIEQVLWEKIKAFLAYELGVLDQKKEERVTEVLSSGENNDVTNNAALLYMLRDEENKKELLSSIKYSETPRKVLSKARELHEAVQRETIKKINVTVERLKNGKTEVDFEDLEKSLSALIEKVNTENMVNLSSYIMYRKYILNLFNEGLDWLKKNKKQDEGFLHNLLLPKGTTNSIDSNLWLIDDLFLYFEGTSEVSIEDVTIGGTKIIRDLTSEEKEQINAFNKRRMEKRIDLLFFPEEKKCIIIELKDPKVGLNENASQMDGYARLLANFVRSEYSIVNFYTYLITDNFNKYDAPTGYHKIYGIDGFVRHSVDIASFETGLAIANQYSEVIRYTDIYERASKRNNIFFDKLSVRHSEGNILKK